MEGADIVITPRVVHIGPTEFHQAREWSEPLKLDTFRLGKFGRVKILYNEGGTDLAMKNQRSFSLEFKRQVIEELLSGESSPAQLCRRYSISSSLLYHWKKQYSRGSLIMSHRGSCFEGQDRKTGEVSR